MRPVGSAAELEARRRFAVSLLEKGEGVGKVAQLLGVPRSSVNRWRKAARLGGKEALAAKPHPGRKPRLTAAQKQRLVKILLKGPRASGYPNDWWTCPRVAEVIRRRFGVRYHPDHVWRILRQSGWTCQKPEQRARERNAAAIRRWRQRDWPRIKKERAAKS